MRSWPTWTLSTTFLSSSLYLDSVNGITKQIGGMVETEVRIFIACLLPWQVFSVGCVPQLLFLRQYLFLDFGSYPLSSLWDWRDISSLYFTHSIFWVSPSPCPYLCKRSLANNKFQFIQTDVPSISGWYLDCPTLIYLTAVMPPVTIYFDVHFLPL